MAKLILLLVFVSFQFSSQEGLSQTPNELINKVPPTVMLDGEDTDHWYKGEDWKDESSEESDEDYDDDFEELEKLIDEIEDWVGKTHPEKGKYQWLLDLGKWFDGDDYDDDDDDDYAQYPEVTKGKNTYYSWLYKTLGTSETPRPKRFTFKRFWSV